MSRGPPPNYCNKSQKRLRRKKYATPTSGTSSQVPPRPESLCKSNDTPTNNLLLLSAALKTHPDRVAADSPERDARTRKFQLVNDAYYTLSDATRRRDYDAQRRLFGPSAPEADPFEEADEEIPQQPGAAAQGAYSWAWNFFNSRAAGAADNADRERTEDAQFSDVFEEMMREEGMAEDGSNAPTSKFWSLVGGLSGGALGFIIANFPGMLAGAVAGNRLGAVRDAKGKSVYEVYSVSLLLHLTAFQGLLGR
ncbi:putative J domain-containing protein C63.13 [Metarhizium anisopliae]|nr:putative J domain-containing protein C63.13 [Metarhizium anisopliae]